VPAVTRHDPRCYEQEVTRPHSLHGTVCYGRQAATRTGHRWVPFPAPLADCNLSDLDGFCYVHKSMQCQTDTFTWDKEHGT
jgi:hypothetical protein